MNTSIAAAVVITVLSLPVHAAPVAYRFTYSNLCDEGGWVCTSLMGRFAAEDVNLDGRINREELLELEVGSYRTFPEFHIDAEPYQAYGRTHYFEFSGPEQLSFGVNAVSGKGGLAAVTGEYLHVFNPMEDTRYLWTGLTTLTLVQQEVVPEPPGLALWALALGCLWRTTRRPCGPGAQRSRLRSGPGPLSCPGNAAICSQ